MTLARDIPLDREAFRDPAAYLQRVLPTPRVRLDTAPIVQRHVNALLLARWFRAAEGQLVAARTGDFFGLPPRLGDPIKAEPPVKRFTGWLADPSTAAVTSTPLARLTFRTVLAGRGDLLDRGREGFATAAAEVATLWAALCGEAAVAGAEARNGLERQATRLKGETLLKELANRSLLPSHGFPNAVVSFLTDCRETVAAVGQSEGDAGQTDRGHRYGAPSRNADIAIRE